MSARLRTITVDSHDHYPLMQFWREVLTDFDDDPEDPNHPGDPESRLLGPAGISLLFLPVGDDKVVKNRIHLDVMPTERTRDEEVERLIALGATLYADHRRADGSGWVVLADPEGNEFCVEPSHQEIEAASIKG